MFSESFFVCKITIRIQHANILPSYQYRYQLVFYIRLNTIIIINDVINSLLVSLMTRKTSFNFKCKLNSFLNIKTYPRKLNKKIDNNCFSLSIHSLPVLGFNKLIVI